MKKIHINTLSGMLLVSAVGLLLFAPLVAQEQEPQTKVQRELVDVVNVEVPVRVFVKDQVIDNLTVDDFLLFEDGHPQKINGFYLKRKKMSFQQVDIQTRQQQVNVRPRFFVLVFQVSDYTESIKKGVELLFRDIIRDHDRVLVFVNDKSLFLDRGYWEMERMKLLDSLLKTQSLKARQNLYGYFMNIKQDLDQMKVRLVERDDLSGTNQYLIINFLKKYLLTWQEYKKKHLLPDMDRYYNFSNFLERIPDEKWVINFYQIEMFPKMKQASEIRTKISEIVAALQLARPEDTVHSQIISELLDNIDRQLNVSDDFPSQQISKMLTKVDATYHTVMMSVERQDVSEDLEFKKVSTDLENSLRAITTQTGGELLSTNDMGSALHHISEKEDVFYVLTYRPTPDQKDPKIDIQLQDPEKRKEYKLFYDDQFRADYISQYVARRKSEQVTLEIKNFSFADKTMSLEIHTLSSMETPQNNRGAISVRALLKNAENKEIFNQIKHLQPKEDILKFHLNFPWLKPGKYYVILEASETASGRTALFFEEISVL